MERVWPGWSHLGPALTGAAAEYQRALPRLADLDALLVLAHVQLETIMRTAEEARTRYEAVAESTRSTSGGDGPIRVALAILDRLSAIQARANIQIRTILEVTEARRKRLLADEGVISPAAFLATMRTMHDWLEQLCGDPDIVRDQIPAEMLARLDGLVRDRAS